MSIKTCAWCKLNTGSLRMLQKSEINILEGHPDVTCIAHYFCDSCWQAYGFMENEDQEDMRNALIANGQWVRINPY